MVVAAPVFVISDNQQRSGPQLRTVERVINVVQKLLAERHVVIRVLAVSRRSPLRLQENITGQTARRHGFLKIAELSEMALRGLRNIGHGRARQRRSVIAINAPADSLFPQCGKDTRRRKHLGR